jgi:hypothetical protein
MRHPNEAALALHAGGDLGAVGRWRMERHLSRCEQCRNEITEYRQIRSVLPDLAEPLDIHWNRLAAEMKANIRLGLAAGECVRGVSLPEQGRRLTGFRAAVAFAAMAALIAAGITLERPAPTTAEPQGIVAEAAPDGAGIQLREGRQAFRLLDPETANVTYTAGAHGSMEARYVDRQTGYITVNAIDVE